MDLSSFSAYFEIFAGLNFLFAGSEVFRRTLDANVFQLGEKLETLNQKLRIRSAEVLVATAEHSTQELKSDIARLAQKVEDTVNEEHGFRGFSSGFQSMFFITGLFCFAILLLSGFEQFSAERNYISLALICLDGVLLFNIFLFVYSFFPSWVGKKIRLIYPFLIFLALFLFSWLLIKISPTVISNLDPRIIISTSILVGVSPFILFFSRSYFHLKYFQNRFRRIDHELESIFRPDEVQDKVKNKRDGLDQTHRPSSNEIRKQELILHEAENNYMNFDPKLGQRELKEHRVKRILSYAFFIVTFLAFVYTTLNFTKIYVDYLPGNSAQIGDLLIELLATVSFAIGVRTAANAFAKKRYTLNIRDAEEELYKRFQRDIDTVLGKQV